MIILSGCKLTLLTSFSIELLYCFLFLVSSWNTGLFKRHVNQSMKPLTIVQKGHLSVFEAFSQNDQTVVETFG